MPTAAALAVIAIAYAVLWVGDDSLGGIVAGVLLLDVGVQGLHVLNQRIIDDVDPAARNLVNSIYMIFYFIGGALGSGAASIVWSRVAWPGVCLTGLFVTALGGLVWVCTSSKKGK